MKWGYTPFLGVTLLWGGAGCVRGLGRGVTSPAEGRRRPRSTLGWRRGAPPGCRAASGRAMSPPQAGSGVSPPHSCPAPTVLPAKVTRTAAATKPLLPPAGSTEGRHCRAGSAAPGMGRGGRGGSPRFTPPYLPKPTPVPTLRQVLGTVDAELERGGTRRWPQQVGLYVLVPRRLLLLLMGGMEKWGPTPPTQGIFFWGVAGEGSGGLTGTGSPARRMARLTRR